VLHANGSSRQKTAKWLNISYRSLLYKLQNSRERGLSGIARPLSTSDPDHAAESS